LTDRGLSNYVGIIPVFLVDPHDYDSVIKYANKYDMSNTIFIKKPGLRGNEKPLYYRLFKDHSVRMDDDINTLRSLIDNNYMFFNKLPEWLRIKVRKVFK